MIARTFSLAVCLACVIACGGRSTDLPTETGNGAGGGDAGSADDGAALPPGVAFMEGNVKCCEPGLGESCCAPDDKETGTCGEFPGCTRAGSGFVGKTQCARCCEGLSRIPIVNLVDGTCVYPSPHEAGSLCNACGNGTCDTSTGENPCNCPADCGPPP